MNSNRKTIATYAINKQAIERMLKWSALEYAEYQYQVMEDYITTINGADAFALYGASKEYRIWWVNQWNLRDVATVENLYQIPSVPAMRAWYKAQHSVLNIIDNSYLANTEAMIVGRVIDELHNAKKESTHG
jgi:hypothetical protein